MRLGLVAIVLAGCASTSATRTLRAEARALGPLVATPLARRFTDAASRLPPVRKRVVAFDGHEKLVARAGPSAAASTS